MDLPPPGAVHEPCLASGLGLAVLRHEGGRPRSDQTWGIVAEAMLRLVRMLGRVSIDAERDERAVLEHLGDVGATPTLRSRLDERQPFVRVGDHARGRWEVCD